jgi:eukaryotic-like serine/threonine-protein kinase
MRLKTLTILLASAFLAVFLSACSGSAFIPSGWTGVAVNEERVYVAHNQYIYAVNLETGQEIWRFPERGQANKTFFADPVLSEDGSQLYAASYNNILYSLNPQSGLENWPFERSRGHLIGSPLVLNGRIYAPSADQTLYALDENRNVLWTYRTGAALWAQPAFSQACGCILLTSMDHNIYALNPDSGALVWQQDLGGSSVGTPTLSEDGGTIFIGSFGGGMFSLDARRGTINWNIPIESWIWAGPALTETRLFFGDLDGNLYALDTSQGRILWQTQPDGPIAGTPLVTPEGIFIGTENGTVVGFDQNGGRLWTQNIGGKIYSSPASAGDMILVAPIETDYRLVALNLNGTERWRYTPQR